MWNTTCIPARVSRWFLGRKVSKDTRERKITEVWQAAHSQKSAKFIPMSKGDRNSFPHGNYRVRNFLLTLTAPLELLLTPAA